MKRNFLLFMPSLIQRDNPPKIAYRYDVTKKVYYGCQTNVPASLLVLDKLNERCEKLNGIIMFCSTQVLNDTVRVENKKQTTYTYYHDTIAAEMHRLGYNDDEIGSAFIEFPLDEINPGSWSSMDKVQNKMLDLIGNDSSADEATLFVDYTGGLRSASMLLVFFSKLLESQGVKVEDVFYSNISRAETGHGDIESCMDTFDIFNYLNAFAAESLDELKRVFSREEDEKFGSLIQSTEDAQRKIRNRRFSDITDAEREAVSITDEMDILHRIAAMQINYARSSLTLESNVRNLASDYNYEQAAQRIKEHGLDLLMKKGIIKWQSNFYEKSEQIKNAFYAYARYYRSYLDFIHDMLMTLDITSDELFDNYLAYTEEKYELILPQKPKGNVAPAIEKEFDKKYSCLTKQMKNELLTSIKEHVNDADEIIKIVDNYIYKRKCYISAYQNGGRGGFPFANILNGWSYSRMCGNKWYSDQYKKSLDNQMYQVCKLQPDERVSFKENVVNDIKTLANAYPPVLCDELFTVNSDFELSFGEKILLMDSIRLGRNLFTHAGERVNEDDEKAMNQLILDFLDWVDSD